jgi:hypothetical protein
MEEDDKIRLQFILDNTQSDVDLRWKLGKFINNGDLSYLGQPKTKELNELLNVEKDD